MFYSIGFVFPFEGIGSVVVGLLLIVAPIVCGGYVFDLYVLLFSTLCPSSFAVILMVKRKLFALP